MCWHAFAIMHNLHMHVVIAIPGTSLLWTPCAGPPTSIDETSHGQLIVLIIELSMHFTYIIYIIYIYMH